MGNVITNEMTRLLLVMGAAVIGLYAVVANWISKMDGDFKPYRKSTVLYVLVSLIFFSIVVFACFPGIFIRPINEFIFLQAFFLVLGIAHFHFMHQYLKWSGQQKAFWVELLFTVLVALVGMIGFLILYRILNKDGMQFFMVGSVLWYIIPIIFYQTFRKATDIPPKIIKQWFYPVNEEIDEPEDSKLKNLLVISFEFQKRTNDPHITNFRAKAPVDMEFGQLFYYFINDYNERHADNKIQYIGNSGKPHGWIFYKKPTWYSVLTSFVDTEKSVFNNHIRENDVIVCTRSQI